MLTLLTHAIRPLFVQRCIDFAMILTPQFGDAFIEQLRVLLLKLNMRSNAEVFAMRAAQQLLAAGH